MRLVRGPEAEELSARRGARIVYRWPTPWRLWALLPGRCGASPGLRSSPSPAAWGRPAPRTSRGHGRPGGPGRGTAGQSEQRGRRAADPAVSWSRTPRWSWSRWACAARADRRAGAVAEPDVGLITNIHPVHLELLGSLEDIAEAKAEFLWVCGPAARRWSPPTARPSAAVSWRRGAAAWCGSRCGPGATRRDVWGIVPERERGRQPRLAVRWPRVKAEVETPFASRHRSRMRRGRRRLLRRRPAVAECLPGVAGRACSLRARGEVIEAGALS